MSLTEIFEPEELVGKLWHRLVGGRASYPRHPEAAVRLDQVSGMLGVYFRSLGGDPGLELAAAQAKARGHRLSLRLRLGMEAERMETARRDGESLLMPPRVELFASRDANRRVYLWLAGHLALARTLVERADDPLRADLMVLRWTANEVGRTLAAFPGLRETYAALCGDLLAVRPRIALPRQEALVEVCVRGLLGEEVPAKAAPMFAWITRGEGDPLAWKADAGYRTYLPVPLWGEAVDSHSGPVVAPRDEDDPAGHGQSRDERDGRKFSASRRDNDQAERDDGIILDRFEKILAMAEMVNVNRPQDEDEDEDPMRAAEDLDEITLSKSKKTTASRIRLDLDLPPGTVDATRLRGQITYPEWDFRRRLYHPDHCVVMPGEATEEGADWVPDEAARVRIRKVRRQFEALRPKRERIPREMDGRELDVDALIRSRCDLAASGEGSDRVFVAFRNESRDLAALILVDVSLSTDSWMENRQVLEVEKEALTTLTHGLAASGDDHAIYTFTSRKRSFVRLDRVKGFDEPLTPTVTRRIAALKPGYYTRMGPAIRYGADRLGERPNRHRLLLLISDGKPNDLDHYDGRYGIEDTRMAIREARRKGLAVFGVTVDEQARDYFPYLFGRGGCAIVSHVGNLTAALPEIFRHLVA